MNNMKNPDYRFEREQNSKIAKMLNLDENYDSAHDSDNHSRFHNHQQINRS